MVTLHATDGDEGITSLGLGVGEEVLEFAGFVATVGVGGVEVVAFGVDCYFGLRVGVGVDAGEIGGDAGERVDGGGAEEEGGSGDRSEGRWEGHRGHFDWEDWS